MNTTILPADPMIDVLTDAIESKRTTIAALEQATKATGADLEHLREARARLLARSAGVEAGCVFLVADRRSETSRPAMVTAIKHGGYYGSSSPPDALDDWVVEFVFDDRGYRNDKPEVDSCRAYEWRNRCFGVIQAGAVVLAGFQAQVETLQRAKAA